MQAHQKQPKRKKYKNTTQSFKKQVNLTATKNIFQLLVSYLKVVKVV